MAIVDALSALCNRIASTASTTTSGFGATATTLGTKIMIVYRVQAVPASDPTEWVNEWHGQKSEAIKSHDALAYDDDYTEVRTSCHDISSGREALCLTLNLSTVNFSVWPGELVKRTPS